ncbi:oxidoreductase domain protein, partial [Methylorubrum extorquens DSM 13060]
MSDDPQLSRRLLLAGGAGLTGAALGLGGAARA